MDFGSIAALITAIAALGAVLFDRQKLKVEKNKLEKDHETSIAEIATKMLAPMSNRIDELEQDISKERTERKILEKQLQTEKKARCRLQQRVEVLVGGIRVLTNQLRENGIEPAFELSEDQLD